MMARSLAKALVTHRRAGCVQGASRGPTCARARARKCQRFECGRRRCTRGAEAPGTGVIGWLSSGLGGHRALRGGAVILTE